MKKLVKLSLIASMALSSAYAAEASNVKEMFSNGETSGQVRVAYYSENPDAAGKTSTATAIGGQLKFETASLNGLSLGAAFYTAQAIDALSGDQKDGDYSGFLASDNENYTELAEAYINYATGDFNIRIGRQLIDTPLADSDDIAMTPHTFEAMVASYALPDIGLTFLAANIQRWQGVDSDYENVTNDSWADTSVGDTNLVAALYANDMIEAGLWYYDVDDVAKATYADAVVALPIDGAEVSVGVQYLSESEQASSTIDGSIAGAMVEASFGDITAGLAYNTLSLDTGKTIFEGFGGGSSFTNMETTTAGSIGEDGKSFVASVGYDFSGVNVFAAYGKFEADTSANFETTELDAGVSYEFNDGEADISLVYVDV
ncbi:MAG: hypothetical protein U9N02_03400, partial [Campylobacterota bacterium]|nr:hypothetical protein [Campylobacterota bacterium]